MLHCRRQSQGAPHWVAYFPHWVSADAHVAASLQLLGWGGRPGIFVWIFQAGEWQLSCWTYLA